MNVYSGTAEDQKKVEKIRQQYIEHSESKMEQLLKLDAKVKVPGKTIAIILGVLGSIVMGSGMSFVMVWENMTLGVSLSIPGMLVALMAYPLYTLITKHRKKKYAAEIISLSDDVIKEKAGDVNEK